MIKKNLVTDDLYNVYVNLFDDKKINWEINDTLFEIGFLSFIEGVRYCMTKKNFYNYDKLSHADMHALLKSGYKFQVQLTNSDDCMYNTILMLVDSERIENEGWQYRFICDDKVSSLYTPSSFVILQIYFPNGVSYEPCG